MRARILTALTAALLLSTTGARADGLRLPEVQSFVLDNGVEIQIARHATVPLVAVEVWIAAGAVDDPEGRAGLASLTAEALRKGAGDLDAEGFASALDFLGARFSTSVGVEQTRIRVELLSADLPTGLDLLADAILRPALADDEILKLRDQMAERVTSDKENPRNVIGTYHHAHLFAQHPYASPVDGTEVSLPRIDADAVRQFHRSRYTGRRTQITVVGDVDPAGIRQALQERFSSMEAGESARTGTAAPPEPESATVLLVNKSDTPQTWFRIGGIGPSWQDLDDFAATEIVRTVFGGRFTSWLNSALRIEAGLTYGAGYQMWRGEASGEASISSFTATATTREAFDLALAQLDRLHDEGLGEDDLASARAYLRGQLPYDYETASDIAAGLAELKFHGIGRDHVDALFERIDAVSLEDCDAAIERWFTRENLQFTVVGVADEIREVLADYGEVTVRENSDPGFAPTAEETRSR